MARGSAGESALSRHLRVLDTFDALHPFRTLVEIAEAADLPRSTAHRLLAELVAEGLVERGPERTYRLGARLWEYAARAPGLVGLRELARPWLAGVHRAVRQHTQLGVRSGRDVLFVERLSASGAVVNATLIGGRLPLHASSSGLVLLAHAPASARDEVRASPMRRFTEATPTTPRELDRALRRVRSDGFARTDGWIHPESRGIAVPITGPDGAVVAAIGVVVANDATPVDPIVEVLAVASAGVSAALRSALTADEDPGGRSPGAIAGLSDRSRAYIESLATGVPDGLIHG